MEPNFQLYTTTREIVERTCSEGFPKFYDEQYKVEFDLEDRHSEVKVDINKQIVMIYSYILGYRVTGKDSIKRLLKYISKVNELLYTGNLEYNFESGEVRYKTSQLFLPSQDPANLIQFLLEQHKANFLKLAAGLKELTSSKEANPIDLANSQEPLN